MKFFKILSVFLLIILFIYTSYITLLPSKLFLFKEEKINLNLLNGVILEKLNSFNNNLVERTNFSLKIFGKIPIKDITVSVIPEKRVIPLGKTIGIKMYSKGVMVVGKSIIKGNDLKEYKPYETTKIEKGDIILNLNNEKIETIEDVKKIIENSNGKKVKITYQKNNKIYNDFLIPTKDIEDNKYKIGLWLRDGTMGIGTLSFFDPETNKFAALGHSISDIDTKKEIIIDKGYLNEVKNISFEKGKKKQPGEILGIIDLDNSIGNIEKNTENGIFGKLSIEESKKYLSQKAYKIALRKEIKCGKAKILLKTSNNIENFYDIEILKISQNKNPDTKSMIIKILDEDLIKKTGGIIQGMSGTPIIQNNKLVGIITHVFLNDSTMGYAIFADTMIEKMYSK